MRIARSGRVVAALLFAVAFAACGGGDGGGVQGGGDADADMAGSGIVNVYSHRHYDSDQALFRRFTEETGIQVNVVTASADELITRLENEGAASPADVLITVDAGRLQRAKERGLLQSVESEVLEANVPDHLQDRDNQWFGLTQRARIIVYHRDRVSADALSTYEALAEPQWNDRILIRSSSNVYNQSMLAAMVAHLGVEGAEAWAAGIVENMARAPSGGDTDQIKAVAAGVGDLAISNSYYLARLAESTDPEERRVAEQVAPFFPNQDGRGTHVNVSGAGVTASSSNRDNAIRLIEFLTEDEAQGVFAGVNGEYPVKPGAPWSPTLDAWGDFKADDLDLTRLGELNTEAVRVADRVGWR